MGKTPFSGLSQTALDSRFQSQVWDRLPYETRLALCQEVENRLAARQGLAAVSELTGGVKPW